MSATKAINVYICPDPSCVNYFGASSAKDLNQLDHLGNRGRGANGETIGKPTKRAMCPDCRDAGRGEIERVSIAIEVPLSTIATAVAVSHDQEREMRPTAPPPPTDSGPPCTYCQTLMQRTGSCYTCPGCGNTSGCG